jgi:flagellar motor switch protein FliG
LLSGESPQLAGAILAQLDAATAYAVLATYPQELEAEILISMGKMSELPADVLEHVARALAQELPPPGQATISIDGLSRASDILKAAGREVATEILEKIEEAEPDLARDIRLGMYTFNELKALDQRSMRTLLREVATDRLTIALKGAPEEVTRAIYGGLSERASKLIKDDLEVLGKVRKSDVEAARQEVVQVAMRLESEGAIDLGRGDD